MIKSSLFIYLMCLIIIPALLLPALGEFEKNYPSSMDTAHDNTPCHDIHGIKGKSLKISCCKTNLCSLCQLVVATDIEFDRADSSSKNAFYAIQKSHASIDADVSSPPPRTI